MAEDWQYQPNSGRCSQGIGEFAAETWESSRMRTGHSFYFAVTQISSVEAIVIGEREE